MKIGIDGADVFVSNEGEEEQKEGVVFGETHDFCAAAAASMIAYGCTKHVSYVTLDEFDATISDRLSAFNTSDFVLKVTVEWVDKKETENDQ